MPYMNHVDGTRTWVSPLEAIEMSFDYCVGNAVDIPHASKEMCNYSFDVLAELVSRYREREEAL